MFFHEFIGAKGNEKRGLDFLMRGMFLFMILLPFYGQSHVAETEDISSRRSAKLYKKLQKCSLEQPFGFLDLHGVKGAKEAKEEFFVFMKDSIKKGLSEVKVVTGRGAHSNLLEGEFGILSKSLPSWIKQAGWIQSKVKKCNLSCYGGCYTIFLKTREDLTKIQAETMPWDKKARLRAKAKAESKSFKGCFRNRKYGSKFIIAAQYQHFIFERDFLTETA